MKKFQVTHRMRHLGFVEAEDWTKADIKARVQWGEKVEDPFDITVREVLERNAYGARKETR